MCDDDHPANPSAGSLTRRRLGVAVAAAVAVAGLGLSPLGLGIVEAAKVKPVALDGPGAALQTADRLALDEPDDPIATTASDDPNAAPDDAPADPPPDGMLIFPVEPAADCYILDSFGRGGSSSGSGYHEGIDIMGSEGNPVYALADGILTRRYTNTGTAGWGWTIYDPVNERQFKYFHLTEDANGLEEGDRVQLGDTIGFIGDSGTSAGNFHLHFEIRLGDRWPTQAIDPLPLLYVDTDICGISAPQRG